MDFKIKDQSLKFSWVKDILSDSFIESVGYHNIHPQLREEIWECNLNTKDIGRLKIKNTFWESVMIAWCELNYRKFVPPDEIMYEYLWYNSHIRRADQPFIIKELWQKGLSYFHQLTNYEGKLKNASQIADEFGVNILDVNSILASIPQEWRKTTFMLTDPWEMTTLYQKVVDMKRPTSYAYGQLARRRGAISICYNKWSETLEPLTLEDVEKAFRNINKHTNYTKLRSFQFRLLHKALIFNDRLFHFKVVDSPLCTNCNKQKESVFHFFCECEYAQKLWSEVNNFCLDEFKESFDINPLTILFGEANKDSRIVTNLVVMATKCLMYSFRCQKKKCTISNVRQFIFECEKYELYKAIKDEKKKLHDYKWQNSDINLYLNEYIISEGHSTEDG